MRSAILGVAMDDVERLRAYVEASTRITHTDPKAASGAFVVALAARAAGRNQRGDSGELIEGLMKYCSHESSNELIGLLRRAASSVERNEPTIEFAASIGLCSGVSGYMNHTVSVVLHAAWSHPNDFQAAVVSVVECGGDADTTAAIVGGIVGAAGGKEGIPLEWLKGIWESPRSLTWIEELGRRLATSLSSGVPQSVPTCPWFRLLMRNAFFAAVVLTHGFRRLLPPY